MTQLLKPSNGTHTEQLQNIDLLTSQSRQEQLEILLFQKALIGEDVSFCIEALSYFNQKNKQIDTLDKIWSDTVKERSVFNSLQRVAVTVFAILGMIAVFNGAFQSKNPSSAVIAPSGVESNQK